MVDPVEAANRVVSRYSQMRQLWEDAANDYFDPVRFQTALQSCISTSRTVTFILQSNKRSFDFFDDWYGVYQEKWRADPIMNWAVQARNTIQKKGDLDTYSESKSTIIASYMDGPTTTWHKQDLYYCPRRVLLELPEKFLTDDHIKNNGTLVIERRWVDSELPETEVLTALAHIYAEFGLLLQDLFNRLGAPPPKAITENTPTIMQPLAMDRAIYLAINDGRTIGYRIYSKPVTIDKKYLRKRYKNIVSWEALNSASSLKEVSNVYFRNARALMKRDGFHRPFAFLLKDNSIFRMISIDFPDRAAKYVIIKELADLAELESADAVMLINEAWTANAKDTPSTGFAADAKNRGEALILQAANSNGETYQFVSGIVRKRFRKHKVKKILTPVIHENEVAFIMLPFQKKWNCINEAELEKAMENSNKLFPG